MKCEYCDNEVSAEAIRCPSCGAPVPRATPVVVQQSPVIMQPGAQMQVGGVPFQSASSGMYLMVELKSKWAFILLGIFLGGFGIHNFYLGHVGRGIAKLLISILSLGWLLWVSWIWGVVEICTIRKDAKGLPLET